MIRSALCLILLVLLVPGLLLHAREDSQTGKLIEQLASNDDAVRKEASRKLAELGEKAIDPLNQTVKEHLDPDVRLRALVVLRGIEKSAYGQIRTFAGHTGTIRGLAVSKDGQRALTGSMDHTARLWDLATGKELVKFTGHTSWVWEVAFSPDDKQILTSGSLDKTLRLWNVEDGREIRKFEGHPGRVYGAALSPDGKRVLSGGADIPEQSIEDRSVRLWDKDTGKQLGKWDGHQGFVWRVGFSPDGKKAASIGCNDQSFRIWDVETGKLLVEGKEAHEGNVVGLAFSPNGKRLLTGGRDATCRLWDVATGKLLRKYDGLGDNVEAVAFSRDGSRFLAGQNRVVLVIDTESGKIVHRFTDHTDQVLAVAFLPDGRRAVSAGADQVLRLWGIPR